jgi:hypothetical protein
MSAALTDFLLELAQDPEKADAFKENPRQVMADAGLSEEDQELLLSGDPQAIRNAIDEERLGGNYVTIIFMSVVHD